MTRLEMEVGGDGKVAIHLQDGLDCRPCHRRDRQQRVALLHLIHWPHVHGVDALDEAVWVCYSRVAVCV